MYFLYLFSISHLKDRQSISSEVSVLPIILHTHLIFMKILKFGGTSVGSPQRMKEVCQLINDGQQKIVVLSAMSHYEFIGRDC